MPANILGQYTLNSSILYLRMAFPFRCHALNFKKTPLVVHAAASGNHPGRLNLNHQGKPRAYCG
jgi:hypothetical protein